jgi:hypothetical protein
LRRALISLVVAAALAAATLPGSAYARTSEVAAYAYATRGEAPQGLLRLGQAPTGFTGGPTTASDGETVTVFVEDALLQADPNAVQRWADALAGLLHGPELGRVSLYLGTLDRVRQVCGSQALGCYGRGRIVAIGQDLPQVTALSVVTHEYGHHVASSSQNDPWPAVDWGTKRWASYENVCRKASDGELVPGNEDRFYQLNPGEAFAESYRVLNERRAGLPESAWQVVDESLYPDQAALDLLAQDVTSPWTGGTTTTYDGVLRPNASGRGFRPSTPLDGGFTATLTAGPKLKVALRIVDLDSGKVLAADATPLQEKRLGVTVCGQRTLQVQVKRLSGSGPFTLTIAHP